MHEAGASDTSSEGCDIPAFDSTPVAVLGGWGSDDARGADGFADATPVPPPQPDFNDASDDEGEAHGGDGEAPSPLAHDVTPVYATPPAKPAGTPAHKRPTTAAGRHGTSWRPPSLDAYDAAAPSASPTVGGADANAVDTDVQIDTDTDTDTAAAAAAAVAPGDGGEHGGAPCGEVPEVGTGAPEAANGVQHEVGEVGGASPPHAPSRAPQGPRGHGEAPVPAARLRDALLDNERLHTANTLLQRQVDSLTSALDVERQLAKAARLHEQQRGYGAGYPPNANDVREQLDAAIVRERLLATKLRATEDELRTAREGAAAAAEQHAEVLRTRDLRIAKLQRSLDDATKLAATLQDARRQPQPQPGPAEGMVPSARSQVHVDAPGETGDADAPPPRQARPHGGSRVDRAVLYAAEENLRKAIKMAEQKLHDRLGCGTGSRPESRGSSVDGDLSSVHSGGGGVDKDQLFRTFKDAEARLRERQGRVARGNRDHSTASDGDTVARTYTLSPSRNEPRGARATPERSWPDAARAASPPTPWGDRMECDLSSVTCATNATLDVSPMRASHAHDTPAAASTAPPAVPHLATPDPAAARTDPHRTPDVPTPACTAQTPPLPDPQRADIAADDGIPVRRVSTDNGVPLPSSLAAVPYVRVAAPARTPVRSPPVAPSETLSGSTDATRPMDVHEARRPVLAHTLVVTRREALQQPPPAPPRPSSPCRVCSSPSRVLVPPQRLPT